MKLNDKLCHLIIITIRNSYNNDTTILVIDLFKSDNVLSKIIKGIDIIKINKTILDFYKLYIKNYEFLIGLPDEIESIKDFENTYILSINFNISFNNAFEISETKWWNENVKPNSYITSINLIPCINIHKDKGANLIIHEKNSNISWREIPIYFSYLIFLFLKGLSISFSRNDFKEIDITEFI